MKPIDFAKALGLGAAVLALNMLLLVLVVFLYSMLIEPGRPQSFYNEMAPKLGNWSAPIGGMTLLFLTAWLLGRRRPQRNAFRFGLAVFVSYAAIDAAIGLAMAPIAQLLTPPFVIGMSGGLLAALAGAALATRTRSAA